MLARKTVRYLKRVLVEHHCRYGWKKWVGSAGDPSESDYCSLTWGLKWDAGTRISGDEKYTGHREGLCYSQS